MPPEVTVRGAFTSVTATAVRFLHQLDIGWRSRWEKSNPLSQGGTVFMLLFWRLGILDPKEYLDILGKASQVFPLVVVCFYCAVLSPPLNRM